MTTPSRETVSIICPNCGEERKVSKYNTKTPSYTGLCQKCNGVMGNKARREQSASWKGGIAKSGDGYYRILLEKDNPYYSMANNKGYVLEHRLVMAGHLGRCLEPWELVHHKNGIRDDNRIENLELLPLLSNIALARLEATYKVKVEKAREDGFTKGITQYREEICPVRIEEAKREERERIIKWIKDNGGQLWDEGSHEGWGWRIPEDFEQALGEK